MTLQEASGPNALHEAGSAAPNEVQMPFPPAITEQWEFGSPLSTVEHSFATSGWLLFAEQKLRVAAPGFNTEQ